jgi:hypothetical protein
MLLWFTVAFADPADEFDAAIARMLEAVAAARDATFDLHQQEYVDGKLQEPVVMHVAYRPRNDVYVEWDDGQKVLWVPAQNGGKMRVDPGPLIPVLSLAPDSALATRGQRHTIERVGLQPVADLFAADRARIHANPALRPTVTIASRTVYGRPATCFDATMRKDLEPKLYAARVEVCLDAQSGLALQMRSWDHEDGALRLVESYGYENLRVNVGLPSTTFDAAAQGL